MADLPSRLTILHYPHPMLRRKAEAVREVTDQVREFAARMVEKMREADGIGLAATQVGVPLRMFVCHVPAAEGRSAEADPATASAVPRVYINPRLSGPRGDIVGQEEGCLSLPDITGEVLRSPTITIHAMDEEGRAFTQTGAGLLGRCWQHECDHLDGVLIIDRFTPMSRLKSRLAIRDLERMVKRR